MPEPSESLIARYRNALAKLLPPGKLNTAIGSKILDLCEAIAVEYARLHDRAYDLLEEADPSTSDELLGDWERVVGLPDDCLEPTTDDERRALVEARLRGLGGHTQADYDAVAESLGVTVTEYRRHHIMRCVDPCDSRVLGPEWANVVDVHAEAPDEIPYTRLECEFNRRQRAHALFRYVWSAPVFMDVDGDPFLDVDGEPFLDVP